jgi:hypothetical protein
MLNTAASIEADAPAKTLDEDLLPNAICPSLADSRAIRCGMHPRIAVLDRG